MSHVATVTIDATKVSADATDYIVYVDLNDLPTTGFWDTVANGGGDIRCYKDDDTTELAREVVSCDTATDTGELHIKFSGTLSSSTDTDIHIYADGTSSEPAVTATYGRNAVWSDYTAVWHLDDSAGLDSTGNSHTLTDRGSTTYSSGAAVFDGSSDALTADDDAAFDVGASDNVTIQVAWKADTVSTQGRVFTHADFPSGGNDAALSMTVGRTSGEAEIYVRDGAGDNTGFVDAGTSLSTATWYRSALVIDRSASLVRAYNDGTQGGSFSDSTIDAIEPAGHSIANRVTIGALYDSSSSLQVHFDGSIDEVRHRPDALSSDWLTTEYNNHNSPSTFYTAAAVGGGPATSIPVIASHLRNQGIQ